MMIIQGFTPYTLVILKVPFKGKPVSGHLDSNHVIWKIRDERCNTMKTAAAIGNWLAASSWQCARPCIMSCAELLGKHQITRVPTQVWVNNQTMLQFPTFVLIWVVNLLHNNTFILWYWFFQELHIIQYSKKKL